MQTDKKIFSGLAVITGASSGIGYELAKQFASNGFDLLIVCEGPSLAEAAYTFESLGVRVMHSRIDLRTEEGVEEFYGIIKGTGRTVDAICINAGIGLGGSSFDRSDLRKELDLIKLNVLSTVHLTKLVLKDMLAVGHGKILFTSSIVAKVPGPYESVYAASKAFVQSFAETLREENKDRGITITSLQPGPTADVAREGYEALMKGEENHITGFKNRMQANLAKVMPHALAARMHKEMSRPLDNTYEE